MVLAMFWFFIGLWHLGIVTMSLLGAFIGSMDDWVLEPDCQGSACHEEWRDSFTTCAGTYRATYRIRYLTIGMLGLIFGAMGFQGVLSRSSGMVKSFLYFWLAMIAMFIVLFIWDELYQEFCDKLPRNMQLDVEMFVSRERWTVMRAQGINSLRNVNTHRLNELVGFDWNAMYVTWYSVVILVMAYWCREISKYVKNVDEGPVGLGANFVISNKPDREVQVMAERMSEAVTDYYAAVPHFQSFPELEDGVAFPYIKKGRAPVPSINYGTMGIPRPPPKREL